MLQSGEKTQGITSCNGKSATIEVHDPVTFNLIMKSGVGQVASEGKLANAKIAGSQIARERICGDSNEVHNWNIVRIETDVPIDCGKSGRSYFIPGKA